MSLSDSFLRHAAQTQSQYDSLCREMAAEILKLRGAIQEHHAQKADDRCIEDDDRLYAAAGLPPCDRRVGDKEAMLANCARFIERRCEAGGWPTYVDLEAELEELRRGLCVPGLTACVVCGFEHQQLALRATDGAVLVSKEAPAITECPNGCGFLVAVTWQRRAEEAIRLYLALSNERPSWQPIETAPKNGTPVLLALKNPIPQPDREDLRRFDGLRFVGSCWSPPCIGWTFAAPVGMGGFADEWFLGWIPLPVTPEEPRS